MARLDGVGADAPLTADGKQSHSPYRFDLLPPMTVAVVAKILSYGAVKYGEWSWLDIPPADHLNHAMQHLFAHIAGDDQEIGPMEHARHAVTRLMFWLECIEREAQNVTAGNQGSMDGMSGHCGRGVDGYTTTCETT